jgi:hypothetical protein
MSLHVTVAISRGATFRIVGEVLELKYNPFIYDSDG